MVRKYIDVRAAPLIHLSMTVCYEDFRANALLIKTLKFIFLMAH